jgi:hypothetical protein
MGGGLIVGLSNEDAARFAFLLATPIIAAAGFLKLPELFGSAGDGVRGQAFVGALAAAFTTYLAVKFLLRFFKTNRLTPFGVYCILPGSSSPSPSRSDLVAWSQVGFRSCRFPQAKDPSRPRMFSMPRCGESA